MGKVIKLWLNFNLHSHVIKNRPPLLCSKRITLYSQVKTEHNGNLDGQKNMAIYIS